MRRLLIGGGAIALLLVVLVWGFLARSGTPAGATTVAGVGPAARAGDDAGYTVRYANTSNQAVTNPQFQTVIRIGEQDWMCQGYQDPTSGKDLVGTAAETTPLTIPAQQDLQVTIYCRIPPDVNLDSVQVVQRP